ncbi:MAG TPA: sulfatase [Planctomycetota bacterium]|nr:sulfatase [Planctomycetota bacterium]
MIQVALFALALSVLLTAQTTASTSTEERRPNIVFILSDDHRWDQLGCAGHAILKTPNLDALAARGTRFANAYVTTPICAASRASILTGLYERTHGYTFRTRPLASKHCDRSYPQLLRDRGYRTGFVGKFGVGVPAGTTKQWFDEFKPLSRTPYIKERPDGSKRHVAEITGDVAIDFLSRQSKDRPFALSISFNAPHAEDGDKDNPYPCPEAMRGMYDDVDIPGPSLSSPEIFEAHPDFLKKSFNRQRFFWRWDSPEKYEKNLRAYYRLLSGVDRVVGRVLTSLEELGLSDDTIIIFCGDNGYYMGQRGFAGKWSHYQESLRVPMIICDPRVAASLRGQVEQRIALNVDLPATMLDFAGVSLPAEYQGASLKRFVHGVDVDSWRQDFFCEHLMHVDNDGIPKWEGVTSARWTYARYFEQTPVYEYLHDLESDPNQLVNLAHDAAHAEQLEVMRRRCTHLRDAYGGVYSQEKYPLAGTKN